MLLKIIFLISAAILIVIARFCNAIYDWGTACAHKWHWRRIVQIRERMKYWALPFSKALLVLLAVAYLLAAIFFHEG